VPAHLRDIGRLQSPYKIPQNLDWFFIFVLASCVIWYITPHVLDSVDSGTEKMHCSLPMNYFFHRASSARLPFSEATQKNLQVHTVASKLQKFKYRLSWA